MNPRSLLPMALGVAALAAAAPVAHAAKTPKITAKYTYKVELVGKQTTTWSLNHVGAGPAACDMNQTGSGKEVVRFSSRPTVMYTFDGLSQPYFFQKRGSQVGALKMPLRGTINRQGSVFTQPLPPGTDNCPDGVGGAPPTPDCGTRKLRGLVVEPEYEYKKDRIVLEQSDAAKDPFKHCPAGGSSWPYLLPYDTANRSIGQELPYKDLFEQGKNIIIATGVHKNTTGDLKWTTRLRWELSFRRIRKEGLAKGS